MKSIISALRAKWMKVLKLIRLYSSVMPEGHTGEERIIVEDGKIYIKVLPNVEADSRNGIVHLTTMVSSVKTGISNVQRIKIDVTQLGQ